MSLHFLGKHLKSPLGGWGGGKVCFNTWIVCCLLVVKKTKTPKHEYKDPQNTKTKTPKEENEDPKKQKLRPQNEKVKAPQLL